MRASVQRNKNTMLKSCDFSQNNAKWTDPRDRMIVHDVVVRTIIADLGLQCYFSWTRCCCDGGRNRHGVELFCWGHIYFLMQNLACFVTSSDVM